MFPVGFRTFFRSSVTKNEKTESFCLGEKKKVDFTLTQRTETRKRCTIFSISFRSTIFYANNREQDVSQSSSKYFLFAEKISTFKLMIYDIFIGFSRFKSMWSPHCIKRSIHDDSLWRNWWEKSFSNDIERNLPLENSESSNEKLVKLIVESESIAVFYVFKNKAANVRFLVYSSSLYILWNVTRQ